MNYRTVPMPSPNGTNYEGLYMRVPIQSRRSGYAYDSRRGLDEEDEPFRDDDTESNDLPEGFVARLCKHLADKTLRQDDIQALKDLVEAKENPSALDYEPSMPRVRYASDGHPRYRPSNARLLEKMCPEAARIDADFAETVW